MDPADYEAWYHTPKGRWIAERETRLMLDLLRPDPGASVLDTGAGTGHFTRRFHEAGLAAAGLEPDPAMLAHARGQSPSIPWTEGRAEALPFAEASFDYCTAVTSLCFVADPQRAVAEMWRVAWRGMLVGLLNRDSLLHRRKVGRGGYAGARWDTLAETRRWAAGLDPAPVAARWGTAVLLPGGGPLARTMECVAPRHLPWGAFLALYWSKPRPPPVSRSPEAGAARRPRAQERPLPPGGGGGFGVIVGQVLEVGVEELLRRIRKGDGGYAAHMGQVHRPAMESAAPFVGSSRTTPSPRR